MQEVVEHLPGKLEAPNLNLTTAKKAKNMNKFPLGLFY
jgi:hypothetical protein